MNGLLIGLSYTILTLFLVPGGLIVEAWRNKWFAILGTSTCGIWFYLSTLVLAVVSSALLGLVIRWYKARERGDSKFSNISGGHIVPGENIRIKELHCVY